MATTQKNPLLSDTAACKAILAKAQKNSRCRCLTIDDIRYELERWLRLDNKVPKKYLHGTKYIVNLSSGIAFAKSYNGKPMATIATLIFEHDHWRLLSAHRDRAYTKQRAEYANKAQLWIHDQDIAQAEKELKQLQNAVSRVEFKLRDLMEQRSIWTDNDN